MQPETPLSDQHPSLILSFLVFVKKWITAIAALLWIALSLVISAAVASSARASDHWLGAFCLYAIIFILLPMVPYLGWIERRRKYELLKHH